MLSTKAIKVALELGITGLEVFLFIWMLFNFFEPKLKKATTVLIIFVMVFSSWLVMNYFEFEFFGIVIILELIFLCNLFFNGKVRQKTLVPLSLFAISLAVELALFAASTIWEKPEVLNPDNAIYYVWAVAGRIIYATIFGMIILFHKMRKYNQINFTVLTVFSALPVSISILILVVYNNISTHSQIVQFFLTSLIILIFYLVLLNYYFQRIEREYEENKLKLAKHEIQIRKEKHAEIIKYSEQAKRNYHDMRHRLLMLKTLYENQEFEKADMYIEEIEKKWQSKRVSSHSGNEIFDYLLTSWESEAINKGIRVDIVAQVPNDIDIDLDDLSIILGNTFSNAIEACERIYDRNIEKYISCSIQVNDGFLVYHISNSYDPETIIGKKGIFFASSKIVGVHGIGLISVEHTINNNGGLLSIQKNEQEFMLTATVQL